jgi:lysophospholipase L1-like esterase
MRAINVLLSVLVSLTIGLLVFEGGLRLLGFAPPRSINQFDPSLGWSKEPGARVRKKSEEYDVVLEINELGLREDPMSSPVKPAETFRVLCLGDSFTLGYTVERRDLFVDQLEHRWRAEGRKVDVINAGTEGYSTDQEAAWLLAHGADYQPDLVLLFPYDNDIYWNGQQQYFRFPKPRFRADGSLEQRALADPGREPWWTTLALAGFYKAFFAERSTEHAFQPDGGRGWILKEHGPLLTSPPGFVTEAVGRTEGALRALKARCAELGARLVVVPIPSHSAVDDAYRTEFGEKRLGLPPELWSPDLPVDTFLALGEKLGIETLDARPALRARTAAGEELYYTVDWHLNAAGNEAFASWLAGALDAANPALLPPATTQLAEGAHLPPAAPSKPVRWPYVFLALWVALSFLYTLTYPDEPKWRPALPVGALLAVIFTIVLGGNALIGLLPAAVAQGLLVLFVVAVLGFVAYKLGRRLGTIAELFVSFILRGHWYLMPLVVVLLTIGSLLLVAASSPLVAPFIYTLF